ncbi:MAG TPA: hypothetical protein VF498_09150, partial [Anaerolineales bacterium]
SFFGRSLASGLKHLNPYDPAASRKKKMMLISMVTKAATKINPVFLYSPLYKAEREAVGWG